MFRFLLLIILGFAIAIPSTAQVDSVSPVTDTIPPPVNQPRQTIDTRTDTTRAEVADSNATILYSDSVSARPFERELWDVNENIPLATQIIERHPFFKFSEQTIGVQTLRRKVQGKEAFFYVLTAFLLVFALLRQAFGKYLNDMFRVFFRTTMKQRQIREQLMQNPLSSLMFNIFFVASAGLYVNFMLHYFGAIPKYTPGYPGNTGSRVPGFWTLYLYCCAGLTLIYLGKFIGLKIMGWLFNMRNAADSYTFIVFIINKVIGIFLLPFLVILAFAEEPLYSIALVISWVGIGALVLYRFILGFGAIRNEVRFNLFHFFLYLCAFEITPLLLIYKLLLLVFK